MSNWLVAQTAQRFGQLAPVDLGERGFNVYQPMFTKETINKGRRVTTQRPLLGSYLLIELDFDFSEHYYSIISTRGIARVLMREQKPLCARQTEVDRLRMISDTVMVRQEYEKGQTVIINYKSFANLKGTYVESRDLVDIVLIELLGQLVPVNIPKGNLEAVNE